LGIFAKPSIWYKLTRPLDSKFFGFTKQIGYSMRTKSLMFASGEPDQKLAHSAFFLEQVSLLLVIQFALVNLLSDVFSRFNHLLPKALLGASVGSAFAVICSALALAFAESKRSSRLQLLGKALAGLTTVFAAMSLCAAHFASLGGLRSLIRCDQVPSEIAVAMCLLLLGVGILLVQSDSSFRTHLADAATSCLGFLLLILSSECLFAFANVPGASTTGLPPLSFLVCFGLLTLVVIIRRARHGVFSVFLGNGIGGRIARILAPIIVLINLGREVGRAQIIDAKLFPRRYATATLASIAILVGFSLLVLLCRLINGMQAEIENLSLRDELTGLYSYRGFNLFAEQAFRLARRAEQAFGVLFIDMDNLKKINDEFGHSEGSACLVEIAKLLTATFRETDVIGRLGGDEFVVAGQLDASAMSQAIERLRSEACVSRMPGVHVSLSLSMGYSLSEGRSDETIKSILSRADKAMYKEKRSKKRNFSVAPSKSPGVPNSDTGEALASAERNGPEETRLAV
jgi:diguanylate cyclase (GGDEF)-like protein